jgi:cytidyltransferase-like protein
MFINTSYAVEWRSKVKVEVEAEPRLTVRAVLTSTSASTWSSNSPHRVTPVINESISWPWGRGRTQSPLIPPPTATYRAARGVFGGTFDPPHIGHLILAEAARSELGLSDVVFMPAAQPPHKLGRQVTETVHRVEMVRRATATHGRFSLSTFDAEREGPSYTVTLIELLRDGATPLPSTSSSAWTP